MVAVQEYGPCLHSQNTHFHNKMQGNVSVILTLPRLILEDPLRLYHIRELLMNLSVLTSACLHPHIEEEVSHAHCPLFCFIIYKQKSVII